MTMTHEDVVSILGPVDDALIIDIIATNATLEELREAWAWTFGGDEALTSEGIPSPDRRVAALIELIEPVEEE